jgi:hypothetical protein
VTRDRDVVGRVGEHRARYGAIEHELVAGRIERVAAKQPVRADLPEIAGPRHGYRRRRGRGIGRVDAVQIAGIEQDVDLAGLEAGHFDFDVQLEQLGQLEPQGVGIPAGILGQPVVGDDVGALLGRGEMVHRHRRGLRHAERASGLDARPAGDDEPGLVDDDRRHPAECVQAARDLVDLAGRVLPELPVGEDQTVESDGLKSQVVREAVLEIDSSRAWAFHGARPRRGPSEDSAPATCNPGAISPSAPGWVQ